MNRVKLIIQSMKEIITFIKEESTVVIMDLLIVAWLFLAIIGLVYKITGQGRYSAEFYDVYHID